MSRIEIHLLAGFRCDKRGCTVSLNLPEQTYFRAWENQDAAAAAAGWSGWMGGRTARFYCPDHGPAKPDTMRRLF